MGKSLWDQKTEFNNNLEPDKWNYRLGDDLEGCKITISPEAIKQSYVPNNEKEWDGRYGIYAALESIFESMGYECYADWHGVSITNSTDDDLIDRIRFGNYMTHLRDCFPDIAIHMDLYTDGDKGLQDRTRKNVENVKEIKLIIRDGALIKNE